VGVRAVVQSVGLEKLITISAIAVEWNTVLNVMVILLALLDTKLQLIRALVSRTSQSCPSTLKMKFEDLHTNFLDQDESARRAFFTEYVERRQHDLDTIVVKIKTKKQPGESKSKDKKIPVTMDKLEALRKLGLI